MGKERLKWIDVLRALAMFFVVMGHLYTGNTLYFVLTGPIKMPLFYFLAGYVFNPEKKSMEFFGKISTRIIIPYFIFSLFPIKAVRYLVYGDLTGLNKYLFEFFSGKILWFIPSFIITQIMVYLIYHICHKKEILILVVSMLCFLLGVNGKDVEWMDFWCINTALTAVLYMNFGMLMRCWQSKFELDNIKGIIFNGLIYTVGIICTVWFYPGKSMDVHSVIYYNKAICLLLIVSGICLCMGVTQKVKWGKIGEPWIIFGQETLIIYLTHGTILSILKKGLVNVLPFDSGSLWISLFYTILICFLGTIISKGVGRIFPILVGKKK